MRARRFILTAILMVLAAICSAELDAQRSFSEHNSTMASLQPALVTPLVAPDPRLLQYARFSVSHEYPATGTETDSYGNGRGAGIIANRRFEFDVLPRPYIQHDGSAEDGFGDTSAVAKYRIASGNAEHGSFDVAAILGHCFATGSHKNGATTDSFNPVLAAGYAFRSRFDVITSLGGIMPTGKIHAQGRSVAWNAVTQAHVTPHVWFEVTMARCRTSSLRRRFTSSVQRRGGHIIHSSSLTAACRSRRPAFTPTITI
jgi:hypothetical protein